MKFFKITFLILVTVVLNSCADKILEPELHSTNAPENLFNSLQGIESVLFSAYAEAANNVSNNAAQTIMTSSIMTDQARQYGGGAEVNFKPYQDFNIDPGSTAFLYGVLWSPPYKAIRNSNVIIENIDSAPIEDVKKEQIRSEAKFIRAISYYKLYYRFGPVPLRTSTDQELELPRATDEEMRTFIENELINSISGLPESGSEDFGRAHKGAAIGMLAKFYLNTSQWQKAADRAKEIIDMNFFSLIPDYFELFQPSNDGNKEVIWVRASAAPTLNRDAAMSIMNFTYPPNYYQNPRTGHTFCSSCRNFSAQFSIRDAFYNSFDSDDERRSLIITEYITFEGDTVSLLNNVDDTRGFKYWPDPEYTQGPAYANDIPVVRYADILLTRAEALNELNGPNQESINLINLVRNRAGLDDLGLADYSSKQELRDKLLEERGKEFYLEEKRRNDLIRHGKFIEQAQDRGKNAQEHHVRLPIPQRAIDANPVLEQNSGY